MNETILNAAKQCVEKHIVTTDVIESVVVAKNFWHVPDTTCTVCCLKLANGFTVLGQSACFDPSVFKPELGEKYAYEDAINNMGRFIAFTVASL